MPKRFIDFGIILRIKYIANASVDKIKSGFVTISHKKYLYTKDRVSTHHIRIHYEKTITVLCLNYYRNLWEKGKIPLEVTKNCRKGLLEGQIYFCSKVARYECIGSRRECLDKC